MRREPAAIGSCMGAAAAGAGDATAAGAAIVSALRERGWTLATAESCTAGLLAAAFSQMKGAGEVLAGGVVAYQKSTKTRVLGVPAEALAGPCGAVTGKVAELMATGARRLTGAEIAVATTGVAGPEPDEDGNPVGRVVVAVAAAGRAPCHTIHDFGQLDHDHICRAAIDQAVALLARVLAVAGA